MTIFVPELIRKKRNGECLSGHELRTIISSYTTGGIPDYQMAALLMAIYFQGFTKEELDSWTDAMIHSGQVMTYPNIPEPKVDKHSTGGVGDKISLCLAPAVAALGVPVPMVSGRGLGHTGGTLDKLESIPGFCVDFSNEQSQRFLEQTGMFLIGQTLTLAPADRKLYALRDVTGTVESIPLIASSIMSKKLAEGIDALVLDVKVGKGAFMQELKMAQKLAQTLIAIGQGAGKKVSALLTNMDTPLGNTVGNALEVAEAIDVLQGGGPSDTKALTVELGARMLVLGKKATEMEDGRNQIKAVLSNGQGLRKFQQIIELQGGDPGVCDDTAKLPRAKQVESIFADAEGVVAAIEPRTVAIAALEVGAGRRVKEAAVDPSCGVRLLAKPGDHVSKGEPVAQLHHNGQGADLAKKLLTQAYCYGDTVQPQSPLIIESL